MPQKKSPAKTGGEKTALHYRLTNEEWLQAVHDLKPSERDLLYYLRTLNPFGDRTLDLTVTGLAKALKVHKSTISRALKVLDRKKYIDLDLLAVRVRLRTCCPQATVLPENNDVALEQPVLPQRNQKDPSATDVVSEQLDRSSSNFHSLESLVANLSSLSQTNQTNQTNLISQKAAREDENFLFQEDGELDPEYRNWLQRILNELPVRPKFPEQWIEAQSKRASVQQDFLNYQNARKGNNFSEKAIKRGKYAGSTPADVFLSTKSWCYRALDVGNQFGIHLTLRDLWTDGLQDICAKICDEIPECGIEISENGPEIIRALSKD